MKKLTSLTHPVWHLAGWLGIVALLIRLVSIGLYPLQDTSEARYGEMARLMVETGDWITVWFDHDVPFWGKPPLFIWLAALSFKLLGINEFAARLPSLLVSLGTLGLVWQLAVFQQGLAAGRLVLLILPTTVVFLALAGAILADPVTLLAITLVLTGFWIGWHAKAARQARLWQYLFFVGCAMALLAKGLAALVIAGLPIFCWCLPKGRLRQLWQRFPWITGTGLMLLIAAPWYIAAELKTPGFLAYFFIGEHFQRYLQDGWQGDQYGTAHVYPWGTIWLNWLQGGLPWSLAILVIGARWLQQRWRYTNRTIAINAWQAFLLLWLLCPLLFFSFAHNIIWTYVLPTAPAMALLLAERWAVQRPRWLATTALVTPVLLVIVTIVFRQGGGQPSHKPLLTKVEQLLARQTIANPGAILYLYDRPFSAQFYSKGKAITVTSQSMLHDYLNTGQRHFLIADNATFNDLPADIRHRFAAITHYQDWTLHVVAPKIANHRPAPVPDHSP